MIFLYKSGTVASKKLNFNYAVINKSWRRKDIIGSLTTWKLNNKVEVGLSDVDFVVCCELP